MKLIPWISHNKIQTFATVLLVVSVLLATLFQGAGLNPWEEILISVAFLFFLPLISYRFITKRGIRFIGLGAGDWKRGLVFAVCSLVLMLLLFYLMIEYLGLPAKFLLGPAVRSSFRIFSIYIVISSLWIFIYDFLFRGLLMFSWSERVGSWAILIQFAAFSLFMYLNGSVSPESFWENFQFWIMAPFAGIIAYQGLSIYYSFLAGFFFMLISSAILVKLG